jgi:hypothetical protein
VSVIATMTLVLAAASGGNPHQRPERFAAVPYVIQVVPDLQVRDRYGSVDSVPLPAQPDVPASLVTPLPSVRADRSFYAQVQGVPAAAPALGHGWSLPFYVARVVRSGCRLGPGMAFTVLPSMASEDWPPGSTRRRDR